MDRKMQVSEFAGRGTARIDDYDLHLWPQLLRSGDPLKQNRMAPRGVGANEHDEISKLEIVVTHRNDVFAERTFVARHRGGHAQARVRIDVGSADVSLHQLVRDVVVLRE